MFVLVAKTVQKEKELELSKRLKHSTIKSLNVLAVERQWTM